MISQGAFGPTHDPRMLDGFMLGATFLGLSVTLGTALGGLVLWLLGHAF